LSDEHVVYKNVLKRLPLKPLSIKHQSVSFRLSRTHHNPLFPVNNMDLQIRKDNSDHHRETVQFAKGPAGMGIEAAVLE
jgi:hypothetical protein